MASERQGRLLAADPERLASGQSLLEESGVLVALSNDKRIFRHAFIHHVPSGLRTISQPANAKPLTLPYGVVHQAFVLAQHGAVEGLNGSRLRWQILTQKISKPAFTNEADASAILFTGVF